MVGGEGVDMKRWGGKRTINKSLLTSPVGCQAAAPAGNLDMRSKWPKQPAGQESNKMASEKWEMVAKEHFLNYVHESLVVKNLPAKAGDVREPGSIPGLGRSPGEGNVNTLQYSCLGNPMDRGACCRVVHDRSDLACTPKGGHISHSNANKALMMK